MYSKLKVSNLTYENQKGAKFLYFSITCCYTYGVHEDVGLNVHKFPTKFQIFDGHFELGNVVKSNR